MMRLFSRCCAGLALGILGLASVPHADAQTKKVLVLKNNPITGKPEYVDPNTSVVTRSVTTLLKPVTSPVKKVKTALFGSDFKQVGTVPGFGGRLDQSGIQAPTGVKPKIALTAGRTAALAGSVGGKQVSKTSGKVVKSGVSKVLGVSNSSSK